MFERSYSYNEYQTTRVLELLNIYDYDILSWSGYEKNDQIYAEWALERIKETLSEAVNTSPLFLIETMSETWAEWADKATGKLSKHVFHVVATMAYYTCEYLVNEWWKGVA